MNSGKVFGARPLLKNSALLLCAAISMSIGLPAAAQGANCSDQADCKIMGRVINDATNEPIADALVSAVLQNPVEMHCPDAKPAAGFNCKNEPIAYATPITVKTGKDGVFVFESVPLQPLFISAEHPGFRNLWPIKRRADDTLGKYTPSQNSPPVALRLLPLTSLSGIVRDDKGVAMGNAQIHVYHVHNTTSQYSAEEIVNSEGPTSNFTAANGWFSFENLEPGDYYVLVDPAKPVAKPVTTDTPDATTGGANFVENAATHAVSNVAANTATNPNGEQARQADAAAAAGPPEAPALPLRDAAGKAFGYQVLRYPIATDSDPEPVVHLSAGKNLTVLFQFEYAYLFQVTGIAQASTNAETVTIPLAVTSIVDADGKSIPYDVTTDPATGKFTSWLPSGTYTIETSFAAPDGKYVGELPIKIAGADLAPLAVNLVPDNVVLIAPLAVLHDVPCQKDDLKCVKLNGAGSIVLNKIRFNRCSGAQPAEQSDDIYWKAMLTPGRYAVQIGSKGNLYAKSVTSAGVDLSRTTYNVSASEPPPLIKVVMAEGASVDGKSSQNGKTVAAWIYAIPAERSTMVGPPALSGSDGSFHLEGLVPGNYYLFATDSTVEFNLNDERTVAVWKKLAKNVGVQSGATSEVDLDVIVTSRLENACPQCF